MEGVESQDRGDLIEGWNHTLWSYLFGWWFLITPLLLYVGGERVVTCYTRHVIWFCEHPPPLMNG